MKKISVLLVILLSIPGTLISCKQEGHAHNEEKVEIEFIKQGELTLKNDGTLLKQLDIEVADTENKRQIGLMNRSQMDEDKGMLFIFENDNTSGFWMKETRIPLDIIFVGKDSIVINVQKNAKPYDLNTYPASAPYRYALEVNGGSADKWGIQEGKTKLSWKIQ